MDRYRYVGLHADELQGGTPIGPGEFTGQIDVSDESPQNQRLVDEGLLLVLPSEAETKKAEAEAKKEAKEEGEAQ